MLEIFVKAWAARINYGFWNVRAIQDEYEELLKNVDCKPEGFWEIADYLEDVGHIFAFECWRMACEAGRVAVCRAIDTAFLAVSSVNRPIELTDATPRIEWCLRKVFDVIGYDAVKTGVSPINVDEWYMEIPK